MRKFLKVVFVLLVLTILGSIISYYVLVDNEKTINFFDDIDHNFNNDCLAEDGEEIQCMMLFNYSNELVSADKLTFDDELLNLYREMISVCYSEDTINVNNLYYLGKMYMLINLSSNENNLVICAKLSFDEIVKYDTYYDNYLELIDLNRIELYIPDSKLETIIDIATVERNYGGYIINVKNEILYSKYHLYEVHKIRAISIAKQYDENNVEEGFIELDEFEYMDKQSKKSYTKSFIQEIDSSGTTLFNELFTIKNVDEIEEPASLSFNTNWEEDLMNFSGSFESLHIENPQYLSTIKCEMLNNYDFNESDQPITLYAGLINKNTGKIRGVYISIFLQGGVYIPVSAEYGWNVDYGVNYDATTETYLPINDDIKQVWMFEYVDNEFQKITSETIIDMNNYLICEDMYSVIYQNYDDDLYPGKVLIEYIEEYNMTNYEDLAPFVDINQPDYAKKIFECIFVYN